MHASVRHLDVLYDKLTLTDKVAHAYSLGKERVEDVMEMVRIAGGLTHEEFEAQPRMYTNINSTSPLKHDIPMLDGWMRLARRNQGLVVTPFTLAGAMAPVTMAGAVAQSLAEGLVAVALAQWIRPGAACVIGTFTSNVDMKSGAPAFGTPEYMRATQMTGQLARFTDCRCDPRACVRPMCPTGRQCGKHPIPFGPLCNRVQTWSITLRDGLKVV